MKVKRLDIKTRLKGAAWVSLVLALVLGLAGTLPDYHALLTDQLPEAVLAAPQK